MTLKQQIADDAEDVFLDTDEFAEEIVRYIDGEANNQETLTAIVFWDDEAGTNEEAGEGRHIADRSGFPLLRTVKLEMLTSIASQLRPERDAFVLQGGQLVVFARILARDDALTTVLCFRQEGPSRKLARPLP